MDQALGEPSDQESSRVRTLAIETSGAAGSVALAAGERLVAEARLDPALRTVQTLVPAIRDLLASAGWRPRDVCLVAVSIGPGSFTGLRIGVATAKTLAYALGADVLGIDTLEAIAERVAEGANLLGDTQAPPLGAIASARVLHVASEAYRQQVFAARYQLEPNRAPTCIAPSEILDASAWLARLAAGDLVTGPALAKLADRLPVGIQAVDTHLWEPTAAAVTRIAARRYLAGERHDVWKLAPTYLRPSAAEEKRAERQAEQGASPSGRRPG